MQFLRTSIIPGLIKAVEFNLNHGNLDFKLFELGEVHKVINTNNTNRYIQNSYLGIAWCCFGNKNWKNQNKFDFFDVKGEIDQIFKKLDNDKQTKVIILEGAGKGFSAGHNLKEVKGLKKRNKYQKLFNLCSKLMLQIVEGRKPVIAKVHGAASQQDVN